VYITPKPQITATNPTFTVVGTATSVSIDGSGFVLPTTVNQTPYPGSSVLFTQGSSSNTVTLTPTSFSANQLTVNLPANLLTTTGSYAFVVVNPGRAVPMECCSMSIL